MRIKSRDSESENDDAESASSASRSFFWSLSIRSLVRFFSAMEWRKSFLPEPPRENKEKLYLRDRRIGSLNELLLYISYFSRE